MRGTAEEVSGEWNSRSDYGTQRPKRDAVREHTLKRSANGIDCRLLKIIGSIEKGRYLLMCLRALLFHYICEGLSVMYHL